jgi:hypothetical protein
MMPKLYTSLAWRRWPLASSSGAMWVTVPYVRVLRWLWPCASALLSPKSHTWARQPKGSAAQGGGGGAQGGEVTS